MCAVCPRQEVQGWKLAHQHRRHPPFREDGFAGNVEQGMCLLQTAKKLLDGKMSSPKSLETGLVSIAKKDFTKMPSNCQWKQRWKSNLFLLDCPLWSQAAQETALVPTMETGFEGSGTCMCLSLSNTAHLHLCFPPWKHHEFFSGHTFGTISPKRYRNAVHFLYPRAQKDQMFIWT